MSRVYSKLSIIFLLLDLTNIFFKVCCIKVNREINKYTYMYLYKLT